MNGAASGVADRVRAELFRRIGLADLLHPAAVDDLGAIQGRVDMNSERPLAEWHVHDPRNRLGYLTGFGIRWLAGAQPLCDIGDVAGWPVGILRSTRCIRWWPRPPGVTPRPCGRAGATSEPEKRPHQRGNAGVGRTFRDKAAVGVVTAQP
jgi:hypothetical protein